MKNTNNLACAEVIKSSLTHWQAQSWEWNYFPQFGSLVKIDNNSTTIFGIVYDIQTGSLDSSRDPFPYRKTEAELLQEQPQIFELLCTKFSCLVCGYKNNSSLYYHLAPRPAQIHSFVQECNAQFHRQFLTNEQFLLHLINFSSHVNNFEELLLALCVTLKKYDILTISKLERFLYILSTTQLFDYLMLKRFTHRLLHLIDVKKK